MKKRRKILSVWLMLVLTATALAALPTASVRKDDPVPRVKVTRIINRGLSDADETKSVIEIHWQTDDSLQADPDFFNLILETRYANDAVVFFDTRVEGSARKAEIEIPSLHIGRNRQPAFIKDIRALVTIEQSEAENTAGDQN